MAMDKKLIRNITDADKNITISVFGDIMVDKYIIGKSNRISPESPVPIVVPIKEYSTLGGAGNVISNIRGLGFKAIPIGIVGNDVNGRTAIKMYKDLNCSVDYIWKSKRYATVTKTRIIANGQQVLRLEEENTSIENYLSEESILNVIKNSDTIIISDYGKGALNTKTIKVIISVAVELNVPVLIDPRKLIANFNDYKKCYLITPNFYEAKSLFPDIDNIDYDVEKSAINIQKDYNIENVVITRGEKGMTLLTIEKNIIHFPALTKEVYDVSGQEILL